MSIVIGILITIGGAILVIKSEWFLNNFGRIAWFEAKLGTEGGSRLGYKLIGVGLLLIGIITMTGSAPAFMGWLLSPLLKYNLPQ
ncbi:hypothetical protein GW920_00140 [Candidatus Falkowbacteria bacterium]|uniref:DUF3784 domain-containing protein n=1 Tax=Candidatus Falkowbacteria bacterium CG10_big_fil_rev_8_21_14_0_10_37_18 TaxID=1974562 RepID=A0A2H0VA69_9BACT|nr:hypothetical protein [Candidatus Falkowbacteria bacterium]NCQ13096.1 hypothetical protein [Candidatus Falkowbacteria bacterium]OIO06172.1 MAG: hypothetical protein AUJ26_01360 [Candidatus Falkowbacteria bacterium CG1_02_37_21]PIR95220.1 MAG: hypothetical protein COT93_03445 [Candidatus Falkowbacteria bacterium CG10_big_fil_rev_8_21_14_0_10_37_18]